MGLEDLTFLRTSMSTIYGGHNAMEKLTKSSNHGTPVPINKNLLPFETIVIFIIIKLLFPAGPSTLLILLNLRALFGNLIGMLQQH